MNNEAITIYDVSREAKVSMATVSRVVNGNPNVKETTRQKVLAVIERLDYRPNAVAQGLARKKTTTVGVIIPDITNLYFSALAQGIDDIATMYKYNIILANSDKSATKEIQQLQTLLAKQVDGVIYMGYHLSDELKNELLRSRTPVVLAGSVDSSEQIVSVHIDIVQAVSDSVACLVNHGHKRIALVTGSLAEQINGAYRLEGYKQALQSFGIKYDESLVIESEYSYQSGDRIVSRLKENKATAVLVCDDEIAVGILNAAIDQGITVPNDLEIITYNDSKLTRMIRPQLTSIAPPLYDIGAVAMRLLTKIMNQENLEETQVLLPYRIIHRGTTKK